MASKPKLQANQRSLKHLRRAGLTAEVCEQYRSRVEGKGQAAKFAGGYRKDLFGFMDIIAYTTLGTVAVQTTSRQQLSAHLRKYRRDPVVRQDILKWIEPVDRYFVLHGWERLEVPCVKAAGTKVCWHVTVQTVERKDLELTQADIEHINKNKEPNNGKNKA